MRFGKSLVAALGALAFLAAPLAAEAGHCRGINSRHYIVLTWDEGKCLITLASGKGKVIGRYGSRSAALRAFAIKSECRA